MDDRLIEDVLTQLGSKRVVRKGGNMMASCPFARWTHANGDDRHPSFSVEVNPNGPSRWKCFSCQECGTKSKGILFNYKKFTGKWFGSLADRIDSQEGVDIGKAFGGLKSWGEQGRKRAEANRMAIGGWTVDGYEAVFEESNFLEFLRSIPQYAIDRGITPDQAKAWRVGYHTDFKRLLFLMFDENQKMVGWSCRSIYESQEPKYLHAENMRRDKYLYGEWKLDRNQRIGYLCEGFMDALALDRFGLRNCLAVMGTSCSLLHIDKLAKWFDEVVIFRDNDPIRERDGGSAGMDMANAYSSMLISRGVGVEIAPVVNGKKDPGDWLKEDFDFVMGQMGRVPNVCQRSQNEIQAK